MQWNSKWDISEFNAGVSESLCWVKLFMVMYTMFGWMRSDWNFYLSFSAYFDLFSFASYCRDYNMHLWVFILLKTLSALGKWYSCTQLHLCNWYLILIGSASLRLYWKMQLLFPCLFFFWESLFLPNEWLNKISSPLAYRCTWCNFFFFFNEKQDR